jgi:hypothetical protein
LGHIKKIISTPSGDFIVLDKNGVYRFGHDGHFIRTYGSQGRAANEYQVLTDVGLDSASGTVYVLDGMNKVLLFDVGTGNFKESITPYWDGEVITLDGIMPKSDGGFYVFSANPTYMKSDTEYDALYGFDAKGTKTAEYLPNKEYIIGLGATSYCYENKHLIRPLDSRNIVYEVENEQITPLVSIDFGDKNAPQGAIYNEVGEQDLVYYLSSSYYKNPCYFQQTRHHISYICRPRL